MDTQQLTTLVQYIVTEARGLKNRHTSEVDAPVNYACVFAQSDAEYRELTEAVHVIGRVIKEPNVPVRAYFFHPPLDQQLGVK